MKCKPMLMRSVVAGIILLSSWSVLVAEAKQTTSDSLIRVGMMVNGILKPDSVYVMIQSGGPRVEAKQFMDIIGGSFYPISHIYHQDGLVVQYGRYISFARLGFEKGFVSLNMVDMAPPVSKKFIAGRGYEYFAPLGFLEQAIAGEIAYNTEAGILEISCEPPPGFGSVFPPAAMVAAALQDSGYIVRMGEANKQFPIQYCLTGYSPNANGNNVGVPYFGIQLPAPPGMDSMYSIPLNYNIREDEAVILIGKTPPECKYFSYRSYLMNRFYDYPTPTRKKINASLGETTSLYRMRPDLPLDSMFGRKFAVIMAGDSLLAMQIKKSILEATQEIDSADIFFDILPSGGLFRFGTDPKADWANFLHRVSLFEDTLAQNDYLDHPPLEVIRATRAEPVTQTLFSIQPFLSRTSGMTEFNLLPDMELLEDSIYEKYHGDYTLTWLSSTPFNLESFIAIQEGVDALGDNHDCLYIYSNDFEFGEDDIVITYGVDHSQTGQAVYNNVIIYGKEYFDGFGGITNADMAKSARQYISDTLIADKLFAYSFSRHPIPDNPYVFIVPSDTANNLSGINVGDAALMCNRLYVNSLTKIGPDPLEVIIDRFILLRPKSSGVFEMDFTTPSINVYPNPVTSRATIEVMVPEWSDVEISLFSSTGQQIDGTIPFGHVRGMVRQEINFGNGHSPGIYYLQVIVHERDSHKERFMMSKVVLL